MSADLNFEAEPFGGFSGSHGESAEEFEAVVRDHRGGYAGGTVVRDHRGGYGGTTVSVRPPASAAVPPRMYGPSWGGRGGWKDWRGGGGRGGWGGRGWGGYGGWGDWRDWPGRRDYGQYGSPYYFGSPITGNSGYYPSAWRRTGYWQRWPWLQGVSGFAPVVSGFAPSTVDAAASDPQMVAWVQACLAQVVGAWVPQDGSLGPATQRAVQIFQTQMQLPPSGALDDKTLTALQQACQPQPASAGAPGPRGGVTVSSPGEAPSPPPSATPPTQSEALASNMRTDLNFEAEAFADYIPSHPGGSNNRRRRQRWPWLQTGSAYGAEYDTPFGQGEADLFYETGPAGARDQALVNAQIAQGVKDENKLTDALFYARHPAWKGKALKTASRALRAEWLQIRDALVRPLLKSAKPTSAPVSPPTPAPAPPAPPVQPAKPAPLPSGQQGAGITGFNIFDNIRKYRPAEFQRALAAQAAFQKVKGFLPWYRKIMSAVPGVSIGLDSHGIGNLVFYMDKRSFSEVVQGRELGNKVAETIGSGMIGRLEFGVDFIGLLGLGATILDIARGIENERNVGGVGPQYDKWRRDQALKFVIGLLAEDLSRQDLRNSYFISRNARDLVDEITADLAEYKPLNDAFVTYLLMEDQLAGIARDRGTVPDVLPRDPPRMSAR